MRGSESQQTTGVVATDPQDGSQTADALNRGLRRSGYYSQLAYFRLISFSHFDDPCDYLSISTIDMNTKENIQKSRPTHRKICAGSKLGG
jgi:hypothetical protein